MRLKTTQLQLFILAILLGQSQSVLAANPSCPPSIQVSGFPLSAPWIQGENENSGFTATQPQQDIWLDKGKEYYRCVYIDPKIPNRNDRVIYVQRQIPVNLSAMEKLQYFKNMPCPSNTIQINVGLNVSSPWLRSNFTYNFFSKYMRITDPQLSDAEQQYAEANNITVYKDTSDNNMYCGYAWGFPSGTSVKKLAITRPVNINVTPGSFAPNQAQSTSNGLIAPTAVPGQPQMPAMNKKKLFGPGTKTPVLPAKPTKPPTGLIGHEVSHTGAKIQSGHRTVKPVSFTIRLGSTCNRQTFPKDEEVLHAGKKRKAECVQGKVEIKQGSKHKYKMPVNPTIKKEKKKGFTDEMPDDFPAS